MRHRGLPGSGALQARDPQSGAPVSWAPRRVSCGPRLSQGRGQGSGPLWVRPPPRLIPGLSGATGTFDASFLAEAKGASFSWLLSCPQGWAFERGGSVPSSPRSITLEIPTVSSDTDPQFTETGAHP